MLRRTALRPMAPTACPLVCRSVLPERSTHVFARSTESRRKILHATEPPCVASATTELNRLEKVALRDQRGTIEIRDRPSDAQQTVVAARREGQASCSICDGLSDGRLGGARSRRRPFSLGRNGCARDSARVRCHDTRPHRGARFPRRAMKLVKADVSQLGDEIDSIQQRTRQAPKVIGCSRGGAPTGAKSAAPKAAWARIHRGHELKTRREVETTASARDMNDGLLEGLAERFERAPAELGELVEK